MTVFRSTIGFLKK